MSSAVAIKNRLQQWIDAAGLNYSRVADMAEVNVQTVRRIAKNRSDRVDLPVIQKICEAFEKPVSEFFYGEDE